MARHAWPAVGGLPTKVRTVANALAEVDEVGVFAHHIGGPVRSLYAIDRSPRFGPAVDPNSGVVTTQLRLTPVDLALISPAVGPMLLDDFGGRRLPDWVQQRLLVYPERWAAAISGRRFARQLGRPDVVHRLGGNRMALAAVYAGRQLDSPVVISPSAHPGHWDDDPVSARAYRAADLIVASCRADAQTYLDLGVEPTRVEICAEPSREVQLGGGSKLRSRLGLAGPLIVFIGARREYKGVDVLLAATEPLAITHPEARVAFIGPGPALARQAPNILDVGEVDDDTRDAWYDAADILVLPSAFESWGLVVSEAWSASTAVVTSDIPVLRERVEDSGGGLAVPRDPAVLATALGSLIDDPDRRRAMGAAGRQVWEQQLAPASVARWHHAAYERLIGGHRG